VTKSPGRIASGKRLAEWNKQKSLNKPIKTKIQEPDQEETTIVKPVDWGLNSSMIFALGAVGGVGYLLYSKCKVSKQPEQPNRPVVKEEVPLNRTVVKEEASLKKQLHINRDPFFMQ